MFINIDTGCIFWWTPVPNLREKDLVPWILDKLARHGWWGARHTSFGNIPKGAPAHLKSGINEAAKGLIRNNFIISKPTGYGLEVSLNFGRKREIFEIISRWKHKK
jgi:hypothetical protein